MSARRHALTALTDEWLVDLFATSGAGAAGCALVAVGGYGRGDLAPGSDLDLVLLAPDWTGDSVSEIADRLWYPVWDSGVRVDHSVRTPAEMRRVAAADSRVVLGLLDLRLVAGDESLASAARASALADWRALARTRLPDLRRSVDERRARHGDLAHLIEPDLKESYGGLRDLTILRAVAASWVTDVPHEGLDEAHGVLMDVRDALHDEALATSRRPTDVLYLQEQDAVAERLGIGDADDLLRMVSEAARAITYAADTTWHRVGRFARHPTVRALSRRLRRPGPDRVPIADGVVIHDGEIVLAADARPDRDPTLLLRLAAAAAQASLPVAPSAVLRLDAESAPLGVPWPDEARDSLVSLLGSGQSLVGTWEALDRAGLMTRLIPGWDVVRSAPQRNPLHVYRVDRHLIETAAHAGEHVRDVDRPDLLLVGALLHDIGKGRAGDHTLIGMDLVSRLGPHMGFDADDTAVLVQLVRLHLLLPDMATRRDLDDPSTIEQVAAEVGDRRTLDLLHALTRADAAATGPAAWSEWKASLVRDLVGRTGEMLSGEPVRDAPQMAARFADLIADEALVVQWHAGEPASHVVVVADDRPGLLGAIAGVLALHRLEVKSADTETVGRRAVSEWTVVPFFGEPPAGDLLASDMRRALEGTLDVESRIRTRARLHAGPAMAARVDFVPAASAVADVLEVRAHDEPGLLHRVGAALSDAGAFITAARVSTLGSEVVDVFYLRRPDGARLSLEDRGRVVAAVMEVLHGIDAARGDAD